MRNSVVGDSERAGAVRLEFLIGNSPDEIVVYRLIVAKGQIPIAGVVVAPISEIGNIFGRVLK